MELQIPQQTGAVATRPDEQHLIKTSLKHSKRSKIDVTLLLPHYTVDPDRAVLCDDDPNKLEMSHLAPQLFLPDAMKVSILTFACSMTPRKVCTPNVYIFDTRN